MRRAIVAGNWKAHKTISEARELATAIAVAAEERADVDVVVCPPFTAVAAVAETVRGTRVGVGGQDVFWKPSGAYTGEVTPPMLVDAGAAYVIVGHSERRGRFGVPEADTPADALRVFGDTDAAVNLKARAALDARLTPIVCCGETLPERRAGETDAVVSSQLERGLAGLTAALVAGVVIAYEPVWAIGTGEVCAAHEANRVCRAVRATIARLFGGRTAEAVRIQYGGSVKPENAAELLSQSDIDGALVGGASLKPGDFTAVLRAVPVPG